MTASHKLRSVIILLVLGCTVGCDQTSKHLVRTELAPADCLTLLGGLAELRLAENPGSFLSLGASSSQYLRAGVFVLGVSLGLIVLFAYLVVHAWQSWMSFFGFALVLAGGVSNLIDRVTHQGLV